MIPYSVGLVLGAIAAIVLTILLYVLVLPRKLDGKFKSKFWQGIHNYFHFKKLYIEEVLKFFFILASVACLCCGFFLLISYQSAWGFYSYRKESTFLTGLLLMILGPIFLRLAYEMIMMFILLVRNTIDINNKLKAPTKEETKTPAATVSETVAAPVIVDEPVSAAPEEGTADQA